MYYGLYLKENILKFSLAFSLVLHAGVIVIPSLLDRKKDAFSDYHLVELIETNMPLANRRLTTAPSRASKKRKEINIGKSSGEKKAEETAPEEEDEDSEGDYSGYANVFRVLKLPEFKTRVRPEYPQTARLKGLEAEVIIEIYIDAEGTPRKLVVLKSGGEEFDAAAIEALKNSTFSPAISLEGKAIPVRIRIPFAFELE
ncbi:MAG: energy transducer TonB [Endomicrobiales bacterium]|nr:energy transducer TonB [Endomicrobiales bacterium]